MGILLEFCTMNEFGALTEELLQYFKATIALLPCSTIHCGQQLLKCLFASNIVSQWDSIVKQPGYPSYLMSSSMLTMSPNTSFSASYR